MKNKSSILYILLALGFLFSCTSSNDTENKKSRTLEIYEKWPLGTSCGRISSDHFAQLIKADIPYIEVGTQGLREMNNQERETWVQAMLDTTTSSNIKVWSVHLPFGRTWDISSTSDTNREKCIEELIDIIKITAKLNPHKYVLHGSYEPITEETRQTQIAHCKSSINLLNAVIKEHTEAQLLIENLPRTCLGNTSDELISIVDNVDQGVGICLDTNHALQETTEDFIAKVSSRIGSIHVSDYDAIDERHWPMGTGCIQWEMVIEELVKTGYDGVFMFESGGQPAQLRYTWETVRKIIK